MCCRNNDIKILWVLGLFLFGMVVGCSKSKRDNPYDPANVPFVVPIQKPAYDAQKKGIALSWQYYGRPVKSYRVTRRNIRFNEIEEWTFTTPSEAIPDPLSTEHDVQPVQIFVDNKGLLAGEQYFYEVEIEDAVAKTPQLMGTVTIPGSQMKEVSLDPQVGSAALKWGWNSALEAPVQHEVFRQVSDEQIERIFSTDDPAVVSFVDEHLEGNKLYRYSVRSIMQDGGVWESAPLQRAFFLKDLEWTFPVDPEDYPYFDYVGSNIMMLSVNSKTGVLKSFQPEGRNEAFGTNLILSGGVGGSIIFPQQIQSNNFVFEWGDARYLGRSSNDYIYIASIVNSEVYLASYYWAELSNPFVWARDPWPESDQMHVSIEATLNTVYVVAGNQLRYFIGAPNIEQLGAIDLALSSQIADLAVDHVGNVWVVLPEENRILKGPSVVEVTGQIASSQWQEITTPPNTLPIMISTDLRRQLFLVLDVGNKRVLVYTSEGNLIFNFGGIEGLNFNRDGRWMGDITMMEYSRDDTWGEKVCVMDAYGKVVRFDTLFLDELDPIP